MRLRTFHAATMKEAMARVRAEMGPEAVIVYAYERKRGRGVEVRAAAEGPPRAVSPVNGARIQGTELSLAGAAGARAPKPVANGNGAAKPRKEQAPPKTAAATLESALAFHGLPQRLSSTLCALAVKMGEDDAALALARALDARLSFRPLADLPPVPVMLVGGPGVGKTVTTAKLAARARLKGHTVRVITTDTLRSGAVEQLSKLLNVVHLDAETADSPKALSAWLKAQREGQKPVAIFVDTPGTNALSAGERADLARFIKAGEMEPVLVQAAGADCAEAAADAETYAALGVRRMITTRLDAARRIGSLIAAADAASLAIAEVSLSPYLSEPLNALTAATLARILIAQSKGAKAAPQHKDGSAKEQRVP
jgi:flagellar biosynthesis protein FlhF